MTTSYETGLSLAGLTLGSSQVWGAIRIVPLLRATPRTDLRLHARRVDAHAVVVEGTVDDPRVEYATYIPHAFVLEADGKGVTASRGAQLGRRRDAPRGVRVMHRMVKREDAGLRFLPLHLAFEGFLALHFGGPDVMWPEYARSVSAHGLSPRSERMMRGSAVVDLDEALRTFEVHATQCGLLLFVADAFATAFVVPRPCEYRLLHRSLLEDMFCDLLVRHGAYAGPVQASTARLDGGAVRTFDDVERLLSAADVEQAAYDALLADGLFGRPVRLERVRSFAAFTLERFRSDLTLGVENYLGERIVAADGTLQYLKVVRLSEAQVRRAFLLRTLHEHAWNLDRAAAALNVSRRDLLERLVAAGFGYLFRPHVLHDARLGSAWPNRQVGG